MLETTLDYRPKFIAQSLFTPLCQRAITGCMLTVI
jgi:hypothetical protein